jgi:hypothetical protein
MNKLTIEHLSAYLPWGLETVNFNVGKLLNKPLISKMIPSNILCFVDGSTESKILLRPISDLTKEIEVNGEKFVPILELCKIAFNYIQYERLEKKYSESNGAYSIEIKNIFSFHFDSNDNSFIAMNKGKIVCVPNQLQLFNKLLSWHFDLFDLIKNNLAIDINTLTK